MKYARVELRPPSGSDFGDKPKYNVFMKYARVELRPPSGSDFGDKPKYNVFMKYARVEQDFNMYQSRDSIYIN